MAKDDPQAAPDADERRDEVLKRLGKMAPKLQRDEPRRRPKPATAPTPKA